MRLARWRKKSSQLSTDPAPAWRACSSLDYSIPYRRISTIKEHECVVLTTDLPAEGLAAGDIGTVVHVHKGGEGYEIEFMTLDGQTVAVSTLLANQVRPIGHREIAYARSLAAA